MANGRVCTGFSAPWVATYSNTGTTVTYSSGQVLARGVSVELSLDSATNDNVFYADNVAAESVAGLFTAGTCTLTVDGLLAAAEKLILGLPTADAAGFVAYGSNMNVPNCGIGFVVRYQSSGTGTRYVPVVLPKVRFDVPNLSAATQEDEIDWQTQELTCSVMRDDTTNQVWKYVGGEETTEAAAIQKVKTFLGVVSGVNEN